ncbi:MAG TPA: spore germination protein, partial [Bacillota bacterium]|nr:spore germination protein [Bacillota bacterium]
MKLSAAIKELVIYKEPKNDEGFELLEDEYETDTREDQKKISSDSDSQKDETKVFKSKTPLKTEEWNKAKEKKSQNQKQYTGNIVVPELKKNIERMKMEFNISISKDVIIREFKVARKADAFILYIDGMVDKNTINGFILRQLMTPDYFTDFKEGSVIDYILDNVLSVNKVIKENKYDKIIDYVLNG